MKLPAVMYPQVQDHPLLDGFMVPNTEILIDYFQISAFFSFVTDGCHVTKSGSNFILSDYHFQALPSHIPKEDSQVRYPRQFDCRQAISPDL